MKKVIEINADDKVDPEYMTEDAIYLVYGKLPYINGAPPLPSNMSPQWMLEVTRGEFEFPGSARTAKKPVPNSGEPWIFRSIIRQTLSSPCGIFTRLIITTDDSLYSKTTGEWQQIGQGVPAFPQV